MSMKMPLSAEDVLKRYTDEGLPEFCEIVLSDVNQVGNFGNQPIHVACVRGYVEEVHALLVGGADVGAVGELGNTPLHEAVSQCHIDVVKLLLENGANPGLRNDFGLSAEDIAREKGRQDIADLMAVKR